MQQQMIADPISRFDLRQIAGKAQHMMGCDGRYYFPVTEFLEGMVCNPKVFGYELYVAKLYEMPVNHGETDPISKTIWIREDVYDNACCGKGRDRFTVAHEIGHALLHCGMLKLARVDPKIQVKRYCDPEWQADAFAGELLMPYRLIKGLSVNEIAERCMVSYDAAEYQRRF